MTEQGLDVSRISTKIVEEDKSHTKDILGDKQHVNGEQKILGVKWNFIQDRLIFDLTELARSMRGAEATKRHIVGISTRFYDPLGFMSPVTIRIKMFFQELCMNKIGWDEPLTGQLLKKWNLLLSGFKGVVTSILRCYFWSTDRGSSACTLHGFCDALIGAYAAVVYVRIESSSGNCVNFVTSKTSVTPLDKQTIPRLELLSALLLSKLVTTAFSALNQDLVIKSVTCYTDSKVSLFWIKGVEKEWKPFVQNRVNGIRKLVAAEQWKHCPGKDNPADLTSRGVTPTELAGSTFWRHGPSWLVNLVPKDDDDLIMPEECKKEMKVTKEMQVTRSNTQHSLPIASKLRGISHIMNCEHFSTLKKLLRVTAYVLRFCEVLKARIKGTAPQDTVELTAAEIAASETLWVKESQISLRWRSSNCGRPII